MGIWYRTGTASIANGAAAVTGVATAFLANVKAGDGITFDAGAKWYEVSSVTDNTHLTVVTNFAETTVSAGAYAIDRRSPKWTWPSEFERVVEFLTSHPAMFTGLTDPDAALGVDGSFYLDTAAPAVWYKAGSTWTIFTTTAGADGADGATIRTGSGVPSNGMGNNGDIYVDLTNGRLYGTKAAGAWPGVYTSLKGPQGDIGLTGLTGAQGIKGDTGNPGRQVLSGAAAPTNSDGIEGDFWIDTVTNLRYGPRGVSTWPGSPVSMVGPQGVTGVTGATGPSGATVEVWGLDVSASAGALTVALKRPDGTDPAGGSPVTLKFKSASLASGTPAEVSQAAALSQVLSSGSTLAATANTPLRLWIVAVNDVGIMRLGLVNCRKSSGIMAIDEGRVMDMTSEGGAGAADSAGIIYSSASLTGKGVRILGWAEWSAGLATPGTWVAPDIVHVFTPGSKRPGDRVTREVTKLQAAVAVAQTAALLNLLPMDDTIPTVTEGGLFGAMSYTPVHAANTLAIRARLQLSNTVINYLTVALFKDAGAAALATGTVRAAASYPVQVDVDHDDISGTVAFAYKVRAGGAAAGTTTLNGFSSVRKLGGTLLSLIEIEETMG